MPGITGTNMHAYCFRDNFKGKTIETGKKTLKIILEVCSTFLIYFMLRQELLLDCINTMSQGLTPRKIIFVALPVQNFCESHQ